MDASEWVTEARLVNTKPCRLTGLLITPSAANATVTVYDGKGTGDPVVFSILLGTKNTKNFNFGKGIPLRRGLFIGSFDKTTGVLVHYEWD